MASSSCTLYCVHAPCLWVCVCAYVCLHVLTCTCVGACICVNAVSVMTHFFFEMAMVQLSPLSEVLSIFVSTVSQQFWLPPGFSNSTSQSGILDGTISETKKCSEHCLVPLSSASLALNSCGACVAFQTRVCSMDLTVSFDRRSCCLLTRMLPCPVLAHWVREVNTAAYRQAANKDLCPPNLCFFSYWQRVFSVQILLS